MQTLPVFATVGFREKPIRPIPIEDLTDILEAAVDGRMWRETVVGAEQLLLSKAVRRVASVVDRRVIVVPWPVWAQYALAQLTEWTMKVPLVAKAQVRMLAEGVTDTAPPAASVSDDPRPRRMSPQIRSAPRFPSPAGSGGATYGSAGEGKHRAGPDRVAPSRARLVPCSPVTSRSRSRRSWRRDRSSQSSPLSSTRCCAAPARSPAR
ncbi:hypothetical protein ACWEOH_03895 [Agromyces sp. NPDC004153]